MSVASTISTSRVGRKPVTIPQGVDVKVNDKQVMIKGPKGQMTLTMDPYVDLRVADGKVQVVLNAGIGYCRNGSGSKQRKAIPGTMRSLVENAITGVSQGFELRLTLYGVGYKALMKGKTLNLSLGYSHTIEFHPPEGITIETPSATEIVVKGIDKDKVGQTVADIRFKRLPEPYKGKGVIDPRKPVIRKETKKK